MFSVSFNGMSITRASSQLSTITASPEYAELDCGSQGRGFVESFPYGDQNFRHTRSERLCTAATCPRGSTLRSSRSPRSRGVVEAPQVIDSNGFSYCRLRDCEAHPRPHDSAMRRLRKLAAATM